VTDYPKRGKIWARLLLGTALGGLLGSLLIAGEASADVPRPSAPVQGKPNIVDSAVEKILSDAQAAIKGGNLRLALIYLRNAVHAAPANSSAHAQLGFVLFQTGDPAGAERELRLAWKNGAPEKTVLPVLFQIMLSRQENQEILSEFPDPGSANGPTTADLLKARAFALQRTGHGPEALDAADRSLKLRRDGQGLLARGGLSLQQGDFNSAGKFADEAVKNSPGSVQIALFKLNVLRAGKNDAAAMAWSDQLRTRFPDDLNAEFARLDLLLDQKQYAKAKTEIDGILAMRPGMPLALYYKALAASRAGDSKGAWDLALTLPKDVQEGPGSGLAIAQMAIDAGHPDAATKILGGVVGRDPDNLAARQQLASLYLDQDNANSALTVLSPARDSSDPDIIRLLARTYTRLKRPDDAADILKKIGTAGGTNPQEIRRNAFDNIQAGHLDQAIKDLSEAVAKDPANPVLVAPLIFALTQAQRYDEASTLADKLGANPKQRATAMQLRGDILMRKRNMAGAEAAFNQAIKLEPGNRAGLLSRAGLYISLKKYDAAERDLRAIVARDAKDTAALMLLGDVAAAQGHDADARVNLAKAVAASPQEPAPRLKLAQYLAGHGDLDGALGQTNTLLKMQSSNAAAVELQGTLLLKMGQKGAAVASFWRLASLQPDSAEAQVELGNALLSSGDRAGAARALDTASGLDPKSAMIKAAQISLQIAMGQPDRAVSTAQTFRTANPGPDADLLVADTLVKTKRADQAMDLLSKSFASKPSRAVLSGYGRLAAAQNQSKRADDALALWVQQNPADTGARLEFADFYMARKDTARAVAQYDAVLKQEPNNVLAMNNLGSLIQPSDPNRATSLLSKAVQLAPSSPDVNDSLGWLKVQRKDAAGGLPYLRRAHDLRPKDGEIGYHLAVALDANSKRDEARALLKSLLASGAAFPSKQAALQLSSQWH
jgi:putative PEP-CTERM system TPR-repeat lipoprotein